MSTSSQSYANHVRWHTPHHFIVMPVLIINVVWAAVYFYEYPTWNQGWWIVVSAALVMLGVVTRLNALRVQDRLIKLEEQVRYERLLPPDLARRAAALPLSHTIALRFASDAELGSLLSDVLDGKFSKPADIKRAITNWRPDQLRV